MEIAIPFLASGGTPIPVPQLPIGLQDLFEQHGTTVYRTALRITGSPADAEDVLQNVFLRLLNHQLTPSADGSVPQYMRRAATNASIDLLRRRASVRETQIPEGFDHAGKESTALLKERVRRALTKLDAEDAEMFVLRHLEGLSYDELAAQFGLERGTVGSRLFRIREWLREEISK